MGPHMFSNSPKVSLPVVDPCPHTIRGFMGSRQSTNSNGISIDLSVFAGLAIECDTDGQTTLAMNRIYAVHAVRFNNVYKLLRMLNSHHPMRRDKASLCRDVNWRRQLGMSLELVTRCRPAGEVFLPYFLGMSLLQCVVVSTIRLEKAPSPPIFVASCMLGDWISASMASADWCTYNEAWRLNIRTCATTM